ncbi:MAG: plasmid partitioning protein RepB C-terminal domain-containing protein [Rickettsiales bacterium]|jgi:ParB family chromosome partitioning protein
MSINQNTSITMISIDRINILNPRIRNAKIFDGIVENIAKIGLKRPITVTPCHSKTEKKDYDLVCGQGRLEAFIACGQIMIPAIVINATQQDVLVMSLVENIARRKHRAIDLIHGIEILRQQGYDTKSIASKIGHTVEHINSVMLLLDQGEERLITAVENGQMPIMMAIKIAKSPQDEQSALQEAYESGELSGSKFMFAKTLCEKRKRLGKGIWKVSGKHKVSQCSAEDYSRDIIRTYKQEVTRKQLLERKADVVSAHLVFLKESVFQLVREDHFVALLRAEGLDTMPKQLATLISTKE